MSRFRILLCVSFGFVHFANATPVHAYPALQVYIDGATYDSSTETWVATSDMFQLWVIADIAKKGAINDVKLSAAILTSESGTGSISLTPTTTSLVTDPSTPIAPIAAPLSADGAIPVLSDGTSLPTHGIYGSGVSFFQWELGDFTLTDSPVGDFITSFPTTFSSSGQINVYTIAVSGFTAVHFDAFDTIESKNDAVFAPFSHDGAGFPFGDQVEGELPEPGTLVLWSLGAVALAGFGWRGRRRVA
jgi:hypothetical protein